MEIKMKRILILLSLLCFLSVSVFGQAIPKQFDYQGVLKDASGTALNGDYGLTFRIYNEPTGSTALWSEIQVVNVNNGLFNAHLGSNTPIAGVPFDRVHFLGIQVGTEAELTPRTMFTPSPYSFMSMDVMDEVITTTKIHDGAVTGAKIGSNQVVKSLNGIKDDVILVAGTNITLTPSGNNITINAAGGGGGGTVTQVNTGAGLTGGPITTTGTISIPNDGITSAMLQSNSVTSAKIADGTIVTADIGDNSVTSAKIVDGTIATADLGNNSVTSTKIVDGTITAADIGATQVVKALNNIKDNVTLVAGSNISITPSGQNLTIASTAGGIGGSGTTNYLPKFSGTSTLGNSVLYETSSKIGLGTITPDFSFTVNSEPTAGLGIKVSRGNGGLIGLAIMEDTQPTGLRGWNFEVYEQKLTIKAVQDDGINTIKNLLTFDRNGNVGIGTTAPTYPLSVTGNNTTALIRSVNTAGTSSTSAAGVYGQSNAADWYGYGGHFIGGWRGVYAVVTPTGSNTYYGVYGLVSGGTSPAGTRYGVYGNAQGSGTGFRYGLRGYADGGGSNYGIYATGSGGTTSFGIWASASGGATNYAGYFSGNVTVTGTLSKGGGSFKIDHPLDPTNKYLYHSFVESPDMMNIYNGNVITDGSGFARITLPDWFEALNKDFRYQLTVIGDFAQAIISEKVQNNQFAIRTDKPNVEVSWQVTGIRRDAFAEKYRIPVEELKQGDETGKYIHPEAYGLPETAGIDYERHIEEVDRK
jgi:hypothetical protein